MKAEKQKAESRNAAPPTTGTLEDLLEDDPKVAVGRRLGRRDGREECFDLVCDAAREAGELATASRQHKEAEVMKSVRFRLHEVAAAIRKGVVISGEVIPSAKRGAHRLPARFGNVTAATGRVYAYV